MKQLPNIDLLKDSLSQAKKAIIILGANPNFDTVAAALGFALALKQKNVDTQVASSADMRVEFSRLVGVESVRKKVGNRNLMVSFAYSEDQVEKVSYQISPDGKRFNLVIAPKAGAQPLQPETVNFEFTGAEAEFIATFGVGSNQELDELVKNEHGLMDGAMTVAFTLFPVPAFAKCHLEAQGLSSISELAAITCQGLGLDLNEDSGSNLLAGMDMATQGFRIPSVSADTFETVANLMRAGAQRPPLAQPPMPPSQMPYMPSLRRSIRPLMDQSAPMNANTSQFASLLGGTQASAPADAAPPTPQSPSEFKG